MLRGPRGLSGPWSRRRRTVRRRHSMRRDHSVARIPAWASRVRASALRPHPEKGCPDLLGRRSSSELPPGSAMHPFHMQTRSSRTPSRSARWASGTDQHPVLPFPGFGSGCSHLAQPDRSLPLNMSRYAGTCAASTSSGSSSCGGQWSHDGPPGLILSRCARRRKSVISL